jgi:DNA mismatch repair protein MutS
LLGQPLRDLPEIERRQAVVTALVAGASTRASLATVLSGLGDLERLTGRVAQGVTGVRDFLALGEALRLVPALTAHMLAAAAPALTTFADAIDPCGDVLTLIESAVEEDGEGGARVCPGFCAELDAALAGCRETRQWLTSLERCERERTGIRSLKVGFTKVFGYYIEVTRPNLSLVPPEYVRKQTVAAGERYVTAPLKEAEARIFAADEEIALLERAALTRLGASVTGHVARLLDTAGRLAHLDALRALAEVAARHDWVAPVLDESEALTIVGGRLRWSKRTWRAMPSSRTHCRLGGAIPRLLVVTGPQHGGQEYLSAAGRAGRPPRPGRSFVPAAAPGSGWSTVFHRLGAQDDLAGGHRPLWWRWSKRRPSSTRRRARAWSSSTRSGAAPAPPTASHRPRRVEDLHGRIGARTLFATHYLELTALAAGLPGIANVPRRRTRSRRPRHLPLRGPTPARRPRLRHPGRPPRRSPALGRRPRPNRLAEHAADRRTDAAPPAPLNPAPGSRVAEGVGPPYQLALEGVPAAPDAAARLARELRQLDLAGLTPARGDRLAVRAAGRLG